MIRSLLLIFLAVVMCGCARDRAQSGADAAAGIKAARAALEAGFATQEAINILTGVEKYLPAATGVNPAEWPAPRMSPEEIRQDPKKYDESAPPVPEGWGAQALAALLTAVGVAMWVAKRALPLVPGIGGPAKAGIELVADLAWKFAATKDQKKLDEALSGLQQAAITAQPVIDTLMGMHSADLPEPLQKLLKDDDVTHALIRLSNPPKA